MRIITFVWSKSGFSCWCLFGSSPVFLQWQRSSDLFSLMIGRLPPHWQPAFFIISPLFLLLLLQIIFPFILGFFSRPPCPLPLRSLCLWVLFDRKYSRRCGAVVDLGPWQTPSTGLICIHKSIGYLTLANILGSREWRCWVGRVTLSLVMELWWSVTAPHSRPNSGGRGGCTVKNDAQCFWGSGCFYSHG